MRVFRFSGPIRTFIVLEHVVSWRFIPNIKPEYKNDPFIVVLTNGISCQVPREDAARFALAMGVRLSGREG